MKTKQNHPNEAVRVLRQKHVGPSALARLTGSSKSTAAGWLEGLKPGHDYRLVIESTLGVCVDDWDRAPNKRHLKKGQTRTLPAAAASDNILIGAASEAGAPEAEADDVFAELARLRGHRRQAEAEDRLPAALALAATELRVLRRLAISNGETTLRGQLRAHPTVRRVAAVLLRVDDPDTLGRLRVVLAEHRIEPDPGGDEADDDPVLAPAPDVAARGLRCLLRRTARNRARAEASGEAGIAAKWLAFEARARDVAARVSGHEPALASSPEWAAIRMRLVECFTSKEVLLPVREELAAL